MKFETPADDLSREVKKDKPPRGQTFPKDKGSEALGGAPKVVAPPKVAASGAGGVGDDARSGAEQGGGEEEGHTVVTGVQLVPFEDSLANGVVPPLCTLNPGP